MKKKILLLTMTGLALLGVRISSADICTMDGWYVAASGSASWHNSSFLRHFANIKHKTGYGGNAAIGYLIDSCWRIELEGVFRYYNNDHIFNTGHLQRTPNNGHLIEIAGLLNLLYDIPVSDCLDLYIGGGIGAGQARLKIKSRTSPETSHNDGTKFAYQFLTGFAYNLTSCWDLTLGYRYLAMRKPTFHFKRRVTKTRKIPYSNNFDVGLRFKF